MKENGLNTEAWLDAYSDLSEQEKARVLDFLKGKEVPDEQWRPVPGYEKSYEVSDRGRIRSQTRTVIKDGAPGALNRCTYKGKLMKAQNQTNGYKFIALSDGETRQFRIHRLVASAFIPNPDSKPEVNHKLGIKAFNWAINLEWATHSENHLHAHDNNLHTPPESKGSDNGRAKITEEDVVYIRENPDGLTQPELGEELGLHHSTVQKINTGKLWPHVEHKPSA